MSKSAFYASKESLRKQRELEFTRLQELEAFIDAVIYTEMYVKEAKTDEEALVEYFYILEKAKELRK